MVSFNCDGCGDVVKKPKLDQHFGRCRAPVTCLDCSVQFTNPGQWKGHTTCISEAQKYEKTVYRGPGGKKGKGGAAPQAQASPAAPAVAAPAPASTPAAEPVVASTSSATKRKAEDAPESESKKPKKDDADKAARKAAKAAAKQAKKDAEVTSDNKKAKETPEEKAARKAAKKAAAAAPAPAAAAATAPAAAEEGKETKEEKKARKAAKKAAKAATADSTPSSSSSAASTPVLISPLPVVEAAPAVRVPARLVASAPSTLGMGPSTFSAAYSAPVHAVGATTRISGGRQKQRLVGSASTRNTRWSADTSLPGHKLLSSMGWSAGEGIGGGTRGGAAPVAVALKLDKTGIGAGRQEREARAAGIADAWIGGGGELGGLFERLNAVASASASPAPAAAVEEVEAPAQRKRKRDETAEEKAARKEAEKADKAARKAEEKVERKQKAKAAKALLDVDPTLATAAKEAKSDVAAGRPIRQAARAKFLRAKRMVGLDAASVNEILGIVTAPGTPVTAPGTPQADSSRASPVPDAADAAASAAAARKEARKVAKAKEAEEAARASAAATEAGARPASMKATTEALEPSADPSFQSGGGMRVHHLSVQQYLEQKLMMRRAQIARKQREANERDEAAIWARAATVGKSVSA